MSKALSLKLDDAVYSETESVLKKLDISRNAYINRAIAFMNKYQKRKQLGKQLQYESRLVSTESLDVLREFEALEDEIG